MSAALIVPRDVSGGRLNWRFLDRIWHIRGRVPLPAGQSRDEAFARLSPLFHVHGTTHHQLGDTLTFDKKDPIAQDKMSVFNAGILQIRDGIGGAVLHYHLASRALLYCFLAPLLFLAFAGLTVAAGKLNPPEEPTAAEKAKAEKKMAETLPQHWIDEMMGAPVPEKPGADKAKDGTKSEKKEDKKHNPKPAYIFAGIFVALYLVGRVLEQWLVKRLFLLTLRGA